MATEPGQEQAVRKLGVDFALAKRARGQASTVRTARHIAFKWRIKRARRFKRAKGKAKRKGSGAMAQTDRGPQAVREWCTLSEKLV